MCWYMIDRAVVHASLKDGRTRLVFSQYLCATPRIMAFCLAQASPPFGAPQSNQAPRYRVLLESGLCVIPVVSKVDVIVRPFSRISTP